MKLVKSYDPFLDLLLFLHLMEFIQTHCDQFPIYSVWRKFAAVLAMKHFHHLVFVLSLHYSRTSANCYYPNGTDVNRFFAPDVYLPCNGGDDVSMCCALNRNDADKCRSDGLCLSTWDNNIWRDGCTDPTWKSPQCIKLCTQGTGFYMQGGVLKNLSKTHTTITPCIDGSYCCGNGTIGQACCDNGKGVFLLNGDIVSSSIPFTAASTATAFFVTKSSSKESSSVDRAISTPLISPDKSSSRTTAEIINATGLTISSSPSSPNKSSSRTTTEIINATGLTISPSSSSPDKSSSGKTTGFIAGTVLGSISLFLTTGFAIFLLYKSRHKRPQAVTADQQMVRYPGVINRHDKARDLHGGDHVVELDGVGI